MQGGRLTLDDRTHLFHYTIGQRLPKIVSDGFIDRSRLEGLPTPAVWVSANPEWENSVVKSIMKDGARVRLSKEEIHDLGGGLVRLEVSRSLTFHSWTEFVRLAAVTPEMVTWFEESGRERGADPEHWYACLEPIYRKDWVAIAIWNKNSSKWLMVDF